MKTKLRLCSIFITLFVTAFPLLAQPEVYAWGNIKGIRMDGELMQLNSSLVLVGKDWTDLRVSGKERGTYNFTRNDRTQMITLQRDEMRFYQSVEDLGAGEASIRLQVEGLKDTLILGSFFVLDLPGDKYELDGFEMLQPEKGQELPTAPDQQITSLASGFSVQGANRELHVEFDQAARVIVCKDESDPSGPIRIYTELQAGAVEKGQWSSQSMKVLAKGVADMRPVTMVLDTTVLGRSFRGFGGNFRLQNPDTDPAVIDYCLENMDVRYGRVEMPWRYWQPEIKEDPVKTARNGGIHPHVKASMEMGARLHKLGMPVILSCWSAPDWAITGGRSWGPRPDGLRGNPLDQKERKKIYKSIADYIEYVKDEYGFEFTMFSFNESDLGINVRQTPEEHAKLIRELGAYLESRGLKTTLLLGDTADANGWPFVKAAMDDDRCHPYIGAVSFHSWRGYSDENLQEWARAAERVNRPLLVGEGSMDAAAHRYSEIFEEPLYAMEEVILYIRILKICQPEAILQWQLTADYSPMSGGGVFGKVHEDLTPTQRFYNFKQIADMPEGLKSMPVETGADNIYCAALGDLESGKYVVHVVNTGATRQVNLEGLPAYARFARVYVTNPESRMESRRMVFIRNGIAHFSAPAASFVTFVVEGVSPFRGNW